MHIYYPFSSNFYLTVVLDSNFDTYWQASHVCKMLRLSKNVLVELIRYLPGETFLRFHDLTSSKRCNIFLLSTEQVLSLISKTTRLNPHHRNEVFEKWFDDVRNGSQILYPVDIRKFSELLRVNPRMHRGVSVMCVDLQPDGSVACKSAISVKQQPERLYTDPPSVSSEPATLNPPKSFMRAYMFLLPCLLKHLKGEYLSNNDTEPAAEAAEPSSSVEPAVDQDTESEKTSQTVLPSPPPSPPHSTEPQPASASAETDSFPMEIDEEKCFLFADKRFNTEYKFYAIRASWMSGPVSAGVTPFFDSHDGERFMYIPVKKRL